MNSWRPRQGKEHRGRARSLPELVALLKRPRRIMMMVKAGPAVDQLIDAAAAACWSRVTS
jgi:6-phosphogluconate dehydrogenase